MRERVLGNPYQVRLTSAVQEKLSLTAGRLGVPMVDVARLALSLGLAALNGEQPRDVSGVHRLTEEGARMLTSM